MLCGFDLSIKTSSVLSSELLPEFLSTSFTAKSPLKREVLQTSSPSKRLRRALGLRKDAEGSGTQGSIFEKRRRRVSLQKMKEGVFSAINQY